MKPQNIASRFLFRGQDIQTGELVYGSLFDHKGHYPEIITMHPDVDGKAVYLKPWPSGPNNEHY